MKGILPTHSKAQLEISRMGDKVSRPQVLQIP